MGVDLKKILKGRQERPAKVLIYGFDGVGKTTMAAGAPHAFVLDANKGSLKLPVDRVLVESWDETKEWLGAIEKGDVKCESVILDSLTDLEAMSHASLFSGSTIEKHDGGYGKGDTVAINAWREVLLQLERLRDQGKTIILVAHATVKKFEDPTGPGYERFEVACRPKLAGLLRQWSDFVLFAREDISVEAPKNKAVKAVTTGVRWVYTRRCPAFDAKARGTTLFPERLLLSWSEFAQAVRNDEARSGEMMRDIEAMLAEISDEKLSATVRDWTKAHPEGVVEARNRVAARLEEKRVATDRKE